MRDMLSSPAIQAELRRRAEQLERRIRQDSMVSLGAIAARAAQGPPPFPLGDVLVMKRWHFPWTKPYRLSVRGDARRPYLATEAAR